ncbi:hypothetical protein [Streptomyces sp. NPDC002328]|uniref:hypothetical protein n=1 Tax=Streptomyces sp. NPDC002328 TaxID=3364642 RepID=UPI00367D40B1
MQAPVGRDGGSVFTTAGRVRRRRRAAMTGTAVAVVALSVTLGSGALRADEEKTPVASSPTAHATALQDLLPKSVGKVTAISMEKILTGREPKASTRVGPYDGEYSVARDGGVGYLMVEVFDLAAQRKYPGSSAAFTPCSRLGHGMTGIRQQCTDEAVSSGLLSIWQHSSTNRSDGSMLSAQLQLKDGTVLSVQAWEGYSGVKALGPLLKGFPVNRKEIRDLILRKELLP